MHGFEGKKKISIKAAYIAIIGAGERTCFLRELPLNGMKALEFYRIHLCS